MPAMGDAADKDLDIRPLTPDRIPDLATLFDQGGDPKWCWCTWFRLRNADFSSGGAERHRAVLARAAEEGVVDDRAPGLLAYQGAEVVGWVSLGPREDYERLAHSKTLGPVDEAPVWSIVCFVVGRKHRGQGIAERLLEAAIAYARERGATMLEAYPVDVPEGERIASANVFKGTLAMFERHGFEVVARRQASPKTPLHPIVRLAV
jgi:GNAT superfamily N-acetyltransferase